MFVCGMEKVKTVGPPLIVEYDGTIKKIIKGSTLIKRFRSSES